MPMTNEEKNVYMTALTSGKTSVPDGVEASVFRKFGDTARKLDGLDRETRQVQEVRAQADQRIKALQAEMQKTAGENEACADLLLAAEEARRASGTHTPGNGAGETSLKALAAREAGAF